MSTKQTTEEIRAMGAVKNVSMPKQRWPALLFLVFLILVGIGGIAVLCYKLEHPTLQIRSPVWLEPLFGEALTANIRPT
jgi:hypothetical protein